MKVASTSGGRRGVGFLEDFPSAASRLQLVSGLFEVLMLGILSSGSIAGCQPSLPAGAGNKQSAEAEKALPPAYPRTLILDPWIEKAVQDFQTWTGTQRVGKENTPIFSRVEVQPVTPTVQPYGIGAYQKEPRLPVILTTGPGWSELAPAEKEREAARAFQEIAQRLSALQHEPPLMPTLTVQTPQGLVLGWINGQDKGGKVLHGE